MDPHDQNQSLFFLGSIGVGGSENFQFEIISMCQKYQHDQQNITWFHDFFPCNPAIHTFSYLGSTVLL